MKALTPFGSAGASRGCPGSDRRARGWQTVTACNQIHVASSPPVHIDSTRDGPRASLNVLFQ
jgi:hypothetical protein